MSGSSKNPLETSLRVLPGVTGPRLDLLGRLGLRTIESLLFHFPRSYEDLTDIRPIDRLTAGKIQTVQGEVVELDSRNSASGKLIVSVVLSDGGEKCLEGVWFNQRGAARRFRYGQRVSFSGKVTWFRDHWQMTTPRVQILEKDEEGPETSVVPIYPMTEDLRPEYLRSLMRKAVDGYVQYVPDILPESLRHKHGWPDASAALREVHFPTSSKSALQAKRRFIYEEFLILQLALSLRRRDLRDRQQAPSLPNSAEINARIRRLFPFRLTGDQNRVVQEICEDLAGQRPMQRLVQADVGAGKTAIAVYAMLLCVANKHQAALMAPTEVLARQHFQTLEGYLAHSRVRRLLLTGGLSARERKEALQALKEGEVDLVVGTQALVQEGVEFNRLGLVVIDEQHKFGVHQRARVRRMGIDPHYLVMTATPIPRTVALSVFGDLDVSMIRELPPGRQPVVTRWVPENQRASVYKKLREGLAQGRQAFIVCPLVEESTALEDVKAAKQMYEELKVGELKDFRLGLLHGRQDEATKAEVMEQLRTHEIDVLICTTVVEVGVDVPNATLLLIEHAERFGLSQLHQLRGRVSRGQVAGQCYLFGDPASEEGKERLKVFVRLRDGFALAEADLKLRGMGELLGAKQHGLSEIRLGNLILDADLLTLARRDAIHLVSTDAGLRQPEHADLRQAVLASYGDTLDLAEVG